jgi:hypothetical protein
LSSLTKIFIVLQLVCALVLSVMVVMLVARQEPYRAMVDAEHLKAASAQAALQAKTNEVEALLQQQKTANDERTRVATAAAQENDRLKTDLAQRKIELDTANAKVASLTSALQQGSAANESMTRQLAAKDEEIRRLAPENVSLIQKNAELTRANNELSTQARFHEQAIRKLQEQLASTETKGGATGPASEANTVASLSVAAAQINAKITSVTPTAGRTLLELPLGTRDGVKQGTRLIVYREPGGYVADAVVEKAGIAESVAAVDSKSLKKGETVRAGDMVMSGTAK